VHVSLTCCLFTGPAPPEIDTLSLYDALPILKSSLDEPASEYGLVAESVRHPKDYSSVTYTLRPEARWHDGEKITPDDVIWTFDRSEEHTSELQSREKLVCRLLLEKKNKRTKP